MKYNSSLKPYIKISSIANSIAHHAAFVYILLNSAIGVWCRLLVLDTNVRHNELITLCIRISAPAITTL